MQRIAFCIYGLCSEIRVSFGSGVASVSLLRYMRFVILSTHHSHVFVW